MKSELHFCMYKENICILHTPSLKNISKSEYNNYFKLTKLGIDFSQLKKKITKTGPWEKNLDSLLINAAYFTLFVAVCNALCECYALCEYFFFLLQKRPGHEIFAAPSYARP